MDEFTIVEVTELPLRSPGDGCRRETPEVEKEKDLQEEIEDTDGPWNEPDSAKRLQKIFDLEYMADYSIKVQNSTFRCHKIIVAASSPKIAKMMRTNRKILHLENVTPNHFRFILEIIYGGVAAELVTIEDAFAVGRASYELQVYPATVHCSNILRWHIEPDTVCEILEFAELISDENLKETCIQFIRGETDAVLTNKAFIKCNLATLELILSQKELDRVTELDLFLACARWAEVREQPRKALGSALCLIRFRLLAANDFVQKVMPTKLLTKEEEKLLMVYYLTRRGEMPEGFSNERNKRQAYQIETQLGGEEKICFKCLGPDKYMSTEELCSQPLRFSVNVEMNLIGLKVSSCREGKTDGDKYTENISVLLKDKTGTLIATGTSLQGVNFGGSFNVTFPSPVPISPNIVYSLQYKSNMKSVKHFTCEYAQLTYKTNTNLEIRLLENVFFPVMCFIIAPYKTIDQYSE